MRTTVSLVLVLLLSFLSVLEVSAASLKAGVVTSEKMLNGKQKISVNSVLDVTYGDYTTLNTVKFSLLKEGNEVASQSRSKYQIEHMSAADSVYSVYYSNIAFEGLNAGEEYTMRAEYQGKSGVVVTDPQSITIPASTKIKVVVEHMAKDSDTYVEAAAGEVRSDDKSIRISFMSNGVPLVNERIGVSAYAKYSNSFVTNSLGQIELVGKADFPLVNSVLILSVKSGTDNYEATPVYITDKQEAGTYTAAIRYLDADGNLMRQNYDNSSWPNGVVQRIGVSGLDVLVLKTAGVTGDFKTLIKSANNEMYMFHTSQSALYSAVDGSHLAIIQNGSDYSRLNLKYSWDGAPLEVKSVSVTANNHYKQLSSSNISQDITANVLYVKKDIEYDVTAVAAIPGTDSRVVLHHQIKPGEPVSTIEYAAKSEDFSALKLQVPDRGQGQGQIKVSFLNAKLNFNQASVTVPSADSTVYVHKGEEIHRLTATTTIGNNGSSNYTNQVVLKSFFTPVEKEYSLKAGSSYKSQIILNVLGSNYYAQDEVRNQIVLGENLETRVVMTDENQNVVDLNGNYRIQILDAAGAIVEENSLYWTTEEKDGYLQRVNKREWKPVKSGDYKVQFVPYFYQNGGYVKGEVLAEADLKVLSKQELEVEVRDKAGKLVDLVNKPYLTVDQAGKVTFTVREHVTGAVGKALPGVKITRYGQEIGITDAEGQFTLPASQSSYLGEFFFQKSDYLSKTVSVAVIDPKTQSVIRVRGLDKPEGEYAGGVPLDYAYVQARIKKSDGTYIQQTEYINIDDQQAFLIVEAPSVVGVDFMRYNRSNMGVESKYGYYMYGSVQTNPGKEYSLVLDARDPLQEVSKVKLTEYMEELSLIRKGLSGVDYVPYVIDSNSSDQNYFYATEGTYSVLAHTSRDTFIYRDNVVVTKGDNTWLYTDSASDLATVVAPESGSIYTVDYITADQSKLRGYAYDATQVQLTPGEVIVNLDQMIGSLEYQYNIHLSGDTLKAGTFNELSPGAIAGLDIVGLKNGKLVRSSAYNSLNIGLVDTQGNAISQLSKPRILVTSYGSSSGHTTINPEASSYTIEDEAGNKLYEGSSLSYPLNASVVLKDGSYVVKANVTIDGKTYTLNKKIVLETKAGTIVDPGTTPPGEDLENGGSTPGNGNNPGSGTGSGTGGGTGGGTVTTPVPTQAPNVSVNEQNTKLQELIKNVTGTPAERAAAAQSALSSIANSLKSVTTAQGAEQNSKSLSQALDSAAQLLATIQDPAEKLKIVSSVNDLVSSAPYVLNHLETGEKAVAFAQSLIQNAAAVLNNAQGVAAADILQIKNGIVSSSQAALNKAGEVTIAKENVTVEGNSVSSQLTEGLVSKQIEASKKALAAVSEDLNAKLGAGLASELKVSLTVEIPPVGEGVNKLNTSLPSEILTMIQNNGIDGLKLQMGKTAFTIEPDTFGTVKAGEKITLAAEVVENAVIGKPSQAEPLATLPVMEFSAKVGDKAVKSFEKPINVSFDVSAIDTSKYSAASLEKLTVYVLNETSLTWEAVGGKFDPVTQTVTALRGHFSRYTVMLGKGAFTDVAENHWAVKEINYLLTKGIVEQTAKFNPSDKVNRAQFAAWISKAYGLDGTGLTLPFKDLAAGSAGYNEIAAAYAAGIITGKSASVFDPKATISRQEMATMLARALTLYNGAKNVSDPGNVNAAFTDNGKIAKWAAAGVALTKSSKLFGGFEDGTFRPAQTATKAEAAALIYRLYQLK
ncbi:S-layer homology domain-containing protein [Paenibacillus sp. P3E]|uniref:S-layer homology domain-containing protein n=1 Tax=Paenibacillus sp. P3E TaxID=1349435 RepID=UPI0015BDFC87|nr:S-layer homology domain-containing protein [Paenibacillus sp. P3E]